MHLCIGIPRDVMCIEGHVPAQEPTDEQVEAAARAWMSWQFPGRPWEGAVEAMKQKFRDGATVALRAAAAVSTKTVH